MRLPSSVTWSERLREDLLAELALRLVRDRPARERALDHFCRTGLERRDQYAIVLYVVLAILVKRFRYAFIALAPGYHNMALCV